MMDSMIKEKGITFKELEENLFRSIMEQGQKAMRGFLEEYDKYLADTRDKSLYRDKGNRKTTIKTRFGEITYWRHVYRVVRDDGKVEHVFLLDEVLELDQIGLISAGLAEQMVKGITENRTDWPEYQRYGRLEGGSEVGRKGLRGGRSPDRGL